MSNTIATLVGTNGSGYAVERHVLWAVNGSLWWAFGFTGTLTLASWSSPDGVTWTARNTFALSNIHRNNGCALAVDYKNISSVDVFHFFTLQQDVATANDKVSVVRATASGSTLTFHTTQTDFNAGSASTGATNDGGNVIIASDNKVVVVTGWTTANRDMSARHSSTTDAGTAEQMTALAWTADGDMDGTPASISLSQVAFDIGSTAVGYLADNGSATTTMTGLWYARFNGTTWDATTTGNTWVSGGTFTAQDKNNWGAVARTTSDVHVVYRNGANAYVHRRGTGANSSGAWVAGQSIPTQNSKDTAGLALASDGTSVWLFAVDSVAANTVRYVQWNGTSWGSWTDLEAGSATRLFLGVSPKVQNSQLACYWVEGAVLKVTMLSIAAAAAPVSIAYAYSSN